MANKIKNLPVGAKVSVDVFIEGQPRFGEKMAFTIADKNHVGYPQNAVTLISERIIQCMPFDAKEPRNPDMDRAQYGNNRYIYSNINQFLNSNAQVFKWYRKQHEFDEPPISENLYNNNNEYDSILSGFRNIFVPDFAKIILDTSLTVLKVKEDSSSSNSDNITAKFFLASCAEVGLQNENAYAEGSILALFSNDQSRVAYPTPACVNASTYKNENLNVSNPWAWWLRTPISDTKHNVVVVDKLGKKNYGNAFSGRHGLRPLCNISGDTVISDRPNANGAYEIIYNQPPSAPAEIIVPEQIFSKQNIDVHVNPSTDPDGDPLSYEFSRSVNNQAFTVVQDSASRYLTEYVSKDWDLIQYRCRAHDDSDNYSDYITSKSIAVVHNTPPAISGSDTDVGTKYADFDYTYIVSDSDADTVQVIESIDSNPVRTLNNITLGDELTASVAGDTFAALPIGNHTLSITAIDSAGNESVRNVTFTKIVTDMSIKLKYPLESAHMPVRANIFVKRDIPAGATFKCEITNNPFDAVPAWEDCTNSVIKNLAHVFTNTINASDRFGIDIRITVSKGSAVSPAWISQIGGNFE